VRRIARLFFPFLSGAARASRRLEVLPLAFSLSPFFYSATWQIQKRASGRTFSFFSSRSPSCFLVTFLSLPFSEEVIDMP